MCAGLSAMSMSALLPKNEVPESVKSKSGSGVRHNVSSVFAEQTNALPPNAIRTLRFISLHRQRHISRLAT